MLANVQREIATAQAKGDHVIRAARSFALRWCLPHEAITGAMRLVATLFGEGHDQVAPISLCQVWWNRDWHRLANALPIDAGTRPDPGASLLPDDLPGGR